jgi:catalase
MISTAILAAMIGPLAHAEDPPDPTQVVDTLEQLGGVHKGLRRNHAKGSCAVGTFQGTAAARELSSSALFSEKSVPFVARFSLAGPSPATPDNSHAPRGLALQFQLPKDELFQTTMLNLPVFPVATPGAFFESLQIGLPDPKTGQKDPEKGKAFGAAHPESKAALDWIASHNGAPSYANVAFNSLHAFKFIKGAKETWVKWHFEPRDGVKFMTDAEAAAQTGDFLDQRVTARAKKSPIVWDMIVTIGQKGDPIDNPSVVWPTGRKEIKAGILTMTKAGADAVGTCEDINFDPNVLSAGVEASPDPILQYRSQAYAESYSRRINEK